MRACDAASAPPFRGSSITLSHWGHSDPRPASLVERTIPSIISGSKSLIDNESRLPRAVSSAVEHYVDIVGVTGSIPVLPTIKFQRLTFSNMNS